MHTTAETPYYQQEMKTGTFTLQIEKMIDYVPYITGGRIYPGEIRDLE